MRLLSSVLTFFVLCAPILAVPTTLKSVESFAGERNHGSYIIKLKPGVAKNNILKSLGEKATHQWDAALNGFAGKFSDRALRLLRASPLVESISEDGIMNIFQDSDVVTQTDAPWGLARISSLRHLQARALTSTLLTPVSSPIIHNSEVVPVGVPPSVRTRMPTVMAMVHTAPVPSPGLPTASPRPPTSSPSKFSVMEEVEVLLISYLASTMSSTPTRPPAAQPS